MEFLFWCTFLTGCAVSDEKTGKIPNGLLIFFGVCFVFFKCFGMTGMLSAEDVKEAGFRILFGAAAFLLLFPLFLFRMMGAGDIKLAVILIVFLGIQKGCAVLFSGLCSAAVFSLLFMIQKKILIQRISVFFSYCRQTAQTGAVIPYYDEKRDGKLPGLCLAPFFFAGFLACYAYHTLKAF